MPAKTKPAVTRPQMRPLFTIADLGPTPDPKRLPARLDRLNAAVLMTALGFPVARRTLERADGIAWKRTGAVATALTTDIIEYVKRRLSEAPSIVTGRAPPASRRGARTRRDQQSV